MTTNIISTSFDNVLVESSSVSVSICERFALIFDFYIA